MHCQGVRSCLCFPRRKEEKWLIVFYPSAEEAVASYRKWQQHLAEKPLTSSSGCSFLGCLKRCRVRLLTSHPDGSSQSSIILGCFATCLEGFACGILALKAVSGKCHSHGGLHDFSYSALVSFTHTEEWKQTPDLWNNLDFWKHNVCSVGAFFSSALSHGWPGFKRLLPPINVMPGKQRSKFLPPPKIKASSLRQVFWPIGILLLQIPLEALNVEW